MAYKLKKEKTINKAWQVQIKEYMQKIVDLGVNPNNFDHVKSLLREKENEIQIFKNKL